MNINQNDFVHEVLQPLKRAQDWQDRLFKLLDNAPLSTEEKKGVLEYIVRLQEYAEAAHRMIVEVEKAYGSPATAIALEALANGGLN